MESADGSPTVASQLFTTETTNPAVVSMVVTAVTPESLRTLFMAPWRWEVQVPEEPSEFTTIVQKKLYGTLVSVEPAATVAVCTCVEQSLNFIVTKSVVLL